MHAVTSSQNAQARCLNALVIVLQIEELRQRYRKPTIRVVLMYFCRCVAIIIILKTHELWLSTYPEMNSTIFGKNYKELYY